MSLTGRRERYEVFLGRGEEVRFFFEGMGAKGKALSVQILQRNDMTQLVHSRSSAMRLVRAWGGL